MILPFWIYAIIKIIIFLIPLVSIWFVLPKDSNTQIQFTGRKQIFYFFWIIWLLWSFYLFFSIWKIWGSYFPYVYDIKDCDTHNTNVLIFPQKDDNMTLWDKTYIRNNSNQSIFIQPYVYGDKPPENIKSQIVKENTEISSKTSVELPLSEIEYYFSKDDLPDHVMLDTESGTKHILYAIKYVVNCENN